MRGWVIVFLVHGLGALALATTPADQDLPAHLTCRYGVIGLRPVAVAADTVAVSRVFPRSPAEQAGLRPGDRLLAVAPFRIRTPDELERCIQSFAPDTTIQLEIQRGEERLTLFCAVTDVRRLYFLMGEQGRVPGTAPADRHRRWSAGPDALEATVWDLIETQEARPAAMTLLETLAMETSRYAGDCRLEDVHFILRQPFKGVQMAATLAAELEAAPGLESLLATTAAHLDLPLLLVPRVDETALHPFLDPDQVPLSRQLLAPFFAAGLEAARAFAPLSLAEWQELISGLFPLLGRLGTSSYLDEGDSVETAAHLRTLRLAKQVDLSALFAGAVLLSRLTTPQALRQTHRVVRQLETSPLELPPTLGGDFLYARSTPAGWVLIGGEGPNYYGEPAALIVDLGGDDLYFNNIGTPLLPLATPPSLPWLPVALVIDYRGDDRYIGQADGSAGAAAGGIGLLIDLEGNDLYQGGRLTQGAAFCGIGVLWDLEGDDLYLASAAAQAAAFFGAGLLLDDRGADLYTAAQYAQGFGGPRGMGLLLDRQGADRYLADHQVPSAYGTPGVYRGWSQGVGCGFRGFSSGGLGVLCDGQGNDTYQAGDFSQGTGYFFGLGLLLDQDGDDIYRGSRYAQGAAAHQAAGLLVDQRGDDRYWAGVAASQGAAWDAAVGILEDVRGDDHYLGQELAQGAAAMNSLGLLVDWSGKDLYRTHRGQGYGSGTTFWGGRNAGNLGLFIDAGGQIDNYQLTGRTNHTSVKDPAVGLFLDH